MPPKAKSPKKKKKVLSEEELAEIARQKELEAERLRQEAEEEARRQREEAIRIFNEYVSNRLESLSSTFSEQSQLLHSLINAQSSLYKNMLEKAEHEQYLHSILDPTKTTLSEKDINSFISIWTDLQENESIESLFERFSFAHQVSLYNQHVAIRDRLNNQAYDRLLNHCHSLHHLIYSKLNKLTSSVLTSQEILSSTPSSPQFQHEFSTDDSNISLGIWINVSNASRIDGINFSKSKTYIDLPKSGVVQSLPFERIAIRNLVLPFNPFLIEREMINHPNWPSFECSQGHTRVSSIFYFELLTLPSIKKQAGDWTILETSSHFSSPVRKQYPPPLLSTGSTHKKTVSSVSRDLPELQYQIPLDKDLDCKELVVGRFNQDLNQWSFDDVIDHVIDEDLMVVRFACVEVGAFALFKPYYPTIKDWSLVPIEENKVDLNIDYGEKNVNLSITDKGILIGDKVYNNIEEFVYSAITKGLLVPGLFDLSRDQGQKEGQITKNPEDLDLARRQISLSCPFISIMSSKFNSLTPNSNQFTIKLANHNPDEPFPAEAMMSLPQPPPPAPTPIPKKKKKGGKGSKGGKKEKGKRPPSRASSPSRMEVVEEPVKEELTDDLSLSWHVYIESNTVCYRLELGSDVDEFKENDQEPRVMKEWFNNLLFLLNDFGINIKEKEEIINSNEYLALCNFIYFIMLSLNMLSE
ncbi:hypothetical protein P9112_007978 [Eukaryota sp. TZLM1-RC]